MILHRARAASTLEGAEAVVIGRSNLFGKPMAQLLLGANATVTVCHSRTRDLPGGLPPRRRARSPRSAGRSMVGADWVKPGATVIDVGINRTDDGLVGDVDFDAVAPSRRRDHAGSRRRRPDDDRLPAAQHPEGRADGGRGGRLIVRRLRPADWLLLVERRRGAGHAHAGLVHARAARGGAPSAGALVALILLDGGARPARRPPARDRRARRGRTCRPPSSSWRSRRSPLLATLVVTLLKPGDATGDRSGRLGRARRPRRAQGGRLALDARRAPGPARAPGRAAAGTARAARGVAPI